MVSAGNTGATMASALLRMGRIKGVARPAIATPIPVLGGTPTVLLDAGANAECSAEWLVQFAQMGAVYATRPLRHRRRRGSALLSIGEEDDQGQPAGEGDPRAAGRAGADRRRRRRLRRQRRGPRPHDRRAPTWWSPTASPATWPSRPSRAACGSLVGAVLGAFDDRRRHARRPPRCCCRPWRPLYAAARPRDHRRGHAARASTASASSATGRRRPRAIVNAVRVAHDVVGRRRALRRPTVCVAAADGSERVATSSLDPAVHECTSRRSGRLPGAGSRTTVPARGDRPVPAETHVEQGPIDRQRGLRARSATGWPTSSRSSRRPSHEGDSFADDLDADSLALIELVEALEEELGERTRRLPHRGRGPRGPEDGARRRRLRRRAGWADRPCDADALDGASPSGSASPFADARAARARAGRTGRGAPRTRAATSNERLEFLGDAVLGLVVTDAPLPDATPTCPRASWPRSAPSVVNAAALAEVAAELGARRGPAARQGRGRQRAAGRSRRSWPTPWRPSSAPSTSTAAGDAGRASSCCGLLGDRIERGRRRARAARTTRPGCRSWPPGAFDAAAPVRA